MKVRQLNDVFRVAEKQYLAAGNQDAAAALSAFATNLLTDDPEATVASVVRRLENVWKRKADRQRSTPGSKSVRLKRSRKK